MIKKVKRMYNYPTVLFPHGSVLSHSYIDNIKVFMYYARSSFE